MFLARCLVICFSSSSGPVCPLLAVNREPLVVLRLLCDLHTTFFDEVVQRNAGTGALDDMLQQLYPAQLNGIVEVIISKTVEPGGWLIAGTATANGVLFADIKQESQQACIVQEY